MWVVCPTDGTWQNFGGGHGNLRHYKQLFGGKVQNENKIIPGHNFKIFILASLPGNQKNNT